MQQTAIKALLAALLVFSAIPSAFALKRRGTKNLCDNFTYEVYRKDLPLLTDFAADGAATATGGTTFTLIDQELILVPGLSLYEAVLAGSTDDKDGQVIVYNSGNAQALDCTVIKEQNFVEVKGKDCVYQVDTKRRKVCDQALRVFSGFAFIEGEGAAVLTTEQLQSTTFSSTFQAISAQGTRGINASLSQRDITQGKDGGSNSAGANANIVTTGNSKVNASSYTEATPGSSSTTSSINASSKSGRRML